MQIKVYLLVYFDNDDQRTPITASDMACSWTSPVTAKLKKTFRTGKAAYQKSLHESQEKVGSKSLVMLKILLKE